MSTINITIPEHLLDAIDQACAEQGRTLHDYTLRMILSSVATPVGNEWVAKPKYKNALKRTPSWLNDCYAVFVARGFVPTLIPEDGVERAVKTIASVQGLSTAVEDLARKHAHNQVKKGVAYPSCAHLMRGRITQYLYSALPVPSTLAAELLLVDETLTELPAPR